MTTRQVSAFIQNVLQRKKEHIAMVENQTAGISLALKERITELKIGFERVSSAQVLGMDSYCRPWICMTCHIQPYSLMFIFSLRRFFSQQSAHVFRNKCQFPKLSIE